MNGRSNLEDLEKSIPKPHTTIGCQDLINNASEKSQPYHSGMLRKRPNLSKWLAKKAGTVNKVISWSWRTVILQGGCIYIYKKETDRKPSSSYSLYGYSKVIVEKDDSEKCGYPWVLKIVPVQEKTRNFCFACIDQRDMNKWMKNIRYHLFVGNCMSPEPGLDDSDSVCSDMDKMEQSVYETSSGETFIPIASRLDQKDDWGGSDSDDGEEDYQQIPDSSLDNSQDDFPPSQPSVRSKPLPKLPSISDESPFPDEPAPQPPNPFAGKPPPPLPGQDKSKGSSLDRPPPPIPTEGTPDPRSSMPPPGSLQERVKQFGNKPPVGAKPGVAPKPGRIPGAVSVFPTNAGPMSPTSPRGPASPAEPTPQPRPGRRNSEDKPPSLPPQPPGRKQVPPVPEGRDSVRSTSSSSQRSEAAPPSYSVLEPDDYYGRAEFDSTDKNASSERIKNIAEEGVFLIRPGGTGDDKVLVVYAENDARKYKINKDDYSKFYLNTEYTFDTMNELLAYYMSHDLPKRRTRLTKPYKDV